jgi:hypothetical protein
MRRAGFVGAVTASLVFGFASVAGAASKTYSGTVQGQPGSSITLKVVTKKNGSRTVKGFTAQNVACLTGGGDLTSAGPAPAAKVNGKGKFSGQHVTSPDGFDRVAMNFGGRLTKNGVAGRLTIYDETQGGDEDPCDTGDPSYTAGPS